MTTNNDSIYDFAGIGIGPFNLGLACLAHPIKGLKGLFFDASDRFDWHPGMLLESTTLQIPFLADLVTLADPTSPFSFLNFCKQQGRIYSFYIRENFLLLRQEYNRYCQWAADQLPNLHFQKRVEEVAYDNDLECYVLTVADTKTGARHTCRARKLVLGTGTPPWLPPCCRHLGDRAVHSAQYLPHRADLQRQKSITLIGSGQSAAEIFYDLLQGIDTYGYELHWITSSPRFFPMEYSKLTLEMTSPDYVDYFYNLPAEKRDRLNQQQKALYKGINLSLIGDIYDLLYQKQLTHGPTVSLRTNARLQRAEERDGFLELELHQHEQDRYFRHRTEALVLATGYSYQLPSFLSGVADRVRTDDRGRWDVHRNYSIDRNGGEIFVQNAELHTHGFATPDLGMGCYRNACILRELTGKAPYPIEQRIAFQQFGVAPQEEFFPGRPPVTEKRALHPIS